jgi:predicted AlkP superfamily phosphohydrolase/phosphomutase
MVERLFVFGLDAAPPTLLFDSFRDRLPNFSRLLDRSIYGRLRSCDPPITIPAWMVMFTGREPGELGLYGFRHRKDYSYNEYILPNSRSIKVQRVWDILGGRGVKSFVMGVPPTYPPYKINGWMISGFLTPSAKSRYAYPIMLKYEVEKLVGEYVFDVPFRREDRLSVLNDVFGMTRQHMDVAYNMAVKKDWDLFIYMEIGLDRVQHAFWKYMDMEHPRYVYDERFSDAILRYYVLLDEFLGMMLSRFGDDAAFLIVSDHGAKMMKGAFAINDWLIDNGFLRLKGDVKAGTDISKVEVDWRDTIAWGWGGYYARIFLNVEGREESGIVGRDEYLDVRRDLARKISGIVGPDGERWFNHVYFPEDLYSVVNGNPPDMLVYFDDLFWRSAGTLGYDDYYLPENDTGPDDAVHDYDGIYIFYNRDSPLSMEVDASIYDIAPTILRFFGIEYLDMFKGEPII